MQLGVAPGASAKVMVSAPALGVVLPPKPRTRPDDDQGDHDDADDGDADVLFGAHGVTIGTQGARDRARASPLSPLTGNTCANDRSPARVTTLELS